MFQILEKKDKESQVGPRCSALSFFAHRKLSMRADCRKQI